MKVFETNLNPLIVERSKINIKKQDLQGGNKKIAMHNVAGLSVVTNYCTLKHKQTKDFQLYCIG